MAVRRCGIVLGSQVNIISRRRNRNGDWVGPDGESSYICEDQDGRIKREHGCVEEEF